MEPQRNRSSSSSNRNWLWNMMFKVSIGMNLQQGPFGGGNQFGYNLVNYLNQHGMETIFHLNDPNIDIIMLTEPRSSLSVSAFSDKHIWQYLRHKPNTIVVHRVNECDERKNSVNVNRRLRHANLVADYTVFVSAWLRDLHLKQGMPAYSNGVILNGSNPEIFNPVGHTPWDGNEPLRLVTHHWGSHWNKGFDIYEWIDNQLDDPEFRRRYDFTYIGNLPKNFTFKNATYIAPQSGEELASRLRQHHVYITASLFEPGSNHQNEGALCGLPLLYIQNASMPEYASGYGIEFTSDNLAVKLGEMRLMYAHWLDAIKTYPRTSQQTSKQYYDLFMYLYENQQQFINARKTQHKIAWVANYAIDRMRPFINKTN